IDRDVVIAAALARPRVEVGVAAQALMDLAAEQLVDRLAHRLADDVPAGHLDATQHAEQRRIGALAVALAVDVPPERLDAEGIAVLDMALEDVLDQADDGLRPEARGIDLADAFD